ncbi:hypothetical protein SL003B_3016 [Polymorphum gilvum SL003B-26A1]|uniref:Uncharacterized protein n=1 Tax=Polymorphum gilvum (strain LMG 25793 / CGMCC 1.9160 / SL003B-26A1) TaxID=991905 RepID=F2IW55_POLGS|nr:hypothetical protein SL003B_3016 [Polymorphum gilvum SL003B-26A1]
MREAHPRFSLSPVPRGRPPPQRHEHRGSPALIQDGRDGGMTRPALRALRQAPRLAAAAVERPGRRRSKWCQVFGIREKTGWVWRARWSW